VTRAWAFIVRCHFSIKRVESGDGKHFDVRLDGKNPARIWTNYPDHLIEVVDRLKEVVIEERDGIELIEAYSRSLGPETLVYCDPPYLSTTRRTKHVYSYELTKDDHVRLAETIKNSSMSFVISGYPSELYNELYDDFHKVYKERPAGIGMAKVPTTECLWLSPGVANYHLKSLLTEGWK
jgi:DNA adenine methylase